MSREAVDSGANLWELLPDLAVVTGADPILISVGETPNPLHGSETLRDTVDVNRRR